MIINIKKKSFMWFLSLSFAEHPPEAYPAVGVFRYLSPVHHSSTRTPDLLAIVGRRFRGRAITRRRSCQFQFVSKTLQGVVIDWPPRSPSVRNGVKMSNAEAEFLG